MKPPVVYSSELDATGDAASTGSSDAVVVDPDLEITEEQHLETVRGSPGRLRLTNLVPRIMRTPPRRNDSQRSQRSSQREQDSLSMNSDNATAQSAEGTNTVANFTVASNDTVKASNKTDRVEGGADGGFKKHWNKIKCLMGVKSEGTLNITPPSSQSSLNRQYSHSEDYGKPKTDLRLKLPLQRARTSSSDNRTSKGNADAALDRAKMDQSIRGRFDGYDVLPLGPVHLVSLPPAPESPSSPSSVLPWESLPPYTFTGKPTRISPAEMVTEMLWSSCGKDCPEVILEGFVPGSIDRWSVRIEQRSRVVQKPAGVFSLVGNFGSGIPGLTRVDTDDCETSEDGSHVMPTHMLWPRLWGSQPAPSVAVTNLERIEDEDPLLHLAAEHSIPIDLDENTFCVSERAHLETVHDFVAASLALGRFSTALFIFNKLLKGIDLITDENLRFLKGSALHNIGIIQMWKGDFEQAAETFHLAVQERTKSLPKDHPDIAVSMARKGLCQLALGRLDDALFAHELALKTVADDAIARAKLLSNIAVIHYQKRQFIPALREMTASLEIQRTWLEESIRRDSIVYDASTTLCNMGKLYLERADFQLAYFVYEEALLLQTTIFRKDHDLVLDCLQSLALTKAMDGHVSKAVQILQGCLRSQNTRFGKESPQSIDTIGWMGYLYERLECTEDALKCLTTVKKWQKANLQHDHASLKKTTETVQKLEETLGENVSVWI